MKTIRVPLVTLPEIRSTSNSKDALLKNCYLEEIKDINNQSQINPTFKRKIIKRHGLIKASSSYGDYETTGVSGVTNNYITGIFGWDYNTTSLTSGVESVVLLGVESKVYKYNDSSTPVELTGAGNRITTTSYSTVFNVLNNQYCMMLAGSGGAASDDRAYGELWYITATGTDYTITKVSDADCPGGSTNKNACTGVGCLDGYVFCADEETNKIYHSDLNAPNTWNPNNVITALQYPGDRIVYITDYFNYIVAMGKYHVEFFENVGNTSGSVLKLVKEATLELGCASPNSVQKIDGKIIFLATDKAGQVFVCMLDGVGTQPKRISTNHIEEYITPDNYTGFTQVMGTSFSMNKIPFYMLTASTYNDTNNTEGASFVYNIRDPHWSQWTINDGTNEECPFGVALPFAAVAGSQLNDRKVIFVGPSLYAFTSTVSAAPNFPQMYSFSRTNYNDSGFESAATIKYLIRTPIIDFNTESNKFIRRVSVVGDTPTSAANFTVRYSDDDYQNWSTSNTIDLNSKNFLTNQGRTKRRAYEIASEANVPIRLEYLEFAVDGGSYGL